MAGLMGDLVPRPRRFMAALRGQEERGGSGRKLGSEGSHGRLVERSSRSLSSKWSDEEGERRTDGDKRSMRWRRRMDDEKRYRSTSATSSTRPKSGMSAASSVQSCPVELSFEQVTGDSWNASRPQTALSYEMNRSMNSTTSAFSFATGRPRSTSPPSRRRPQTAGLTPSLFLLSRNSTPVDTSSSQFCKRRVETFRLSTPALDAELPSKKHQERLQGLNQVTRDAIQRHTRFLEACKSSSSRFSSSLNDKNASTSKEMHGDESLKEQSNKHSLNAIFDEERDISEFLHDGAKGQKYDEEDSESQEEQGIETEPSELDHSVADKWMNTLNMATSGNIGKKRGKNTVNPFPEKVKTQRTTSSFEDLIKFFQNNVSLNVPDYALPACLRPGAALPPMPQCPSMWPRGFPAVKVDSIQLPTENGSSKPSDKQLTKIPGFDEQEEVQEGEEDRWSNDLPLFRQEVPELLKEILSTESGEQLALDHFHELVHRLRSEAQKSSWQRAERMKRLEVVRNNKKYLDDMLAKKADLSATPVHDKISAEIEEQRMLFMRQRHYNLQLQRLLRRVRYEHEETERLVHEKEEELSAVFQDIPLLVKLLDEAQIEAAHSFEQLDRVHKLNVKQCENIRTAALERRSQFREKARRMSQVLQEERKENLAKIKKLKEFDEKQKREHRQFMIDSMQDSKLLQRLPYYTQVAMILLGLRSSTSTRDVDGSKRSLSPRKDPGMDMLSDEIVEKLQQNLPEIVARFANLFTTRAAAEERIRSNEETIKEKKIVLNTLKVELHDLQVSVESLNEARRSNAAHQELTAQLEQAVEGERRKQEALARIEELIAKSCSRLQEMAKDICKLSGMDKDLNVMVTSIQLQKLMKVMEGGGQGSKEQGKVDVAVWVRLCDTISNILITLHTRSVQIKNQNIARERALSRNIKGFLKDHIAAIRLRYSRLRDISEQARLNRRSWPNSKLRDAAEAILRQVEFAKIQTMLRNLDMSKSVAIMATITKLQAWVRGVQARKRVSHLKKMMSQGYSRSHLKNAIRVQKIARFYLARLHLHKLVAVVYQKNKESMSDKISKLLISPLTRKATKLTIDADDLRHSPQRMLTHFNPRIVCEPEHKLPDASRAPLPSWKFPQEGSSPWKNKSYAAWKMKEIQHRHTKFRVVTGGIFSDPGEEEESRGGWEDASVLEHPDYLRVRKVIKETSMKATKLLKKRERGSNKAAAK
ncbi:hypothetical protein GUITHDRAFT_138762 [Guillardia theta CCMP2712]|uniref:Uncharacterized protein n=1 Tax=Guillardia theta (strain CCMP2712) TaxID=905079 RepID=L1JB25_GUITC|nr:hypothetical protein GUITHDRAFT_138762 [Guillardia theta CCMP2712]EKX45527.1 hypothetical protein GUITHDRAFT_138762 [Guillardia theta CCMP2712]|eukprot:XP_005832507.1 hypothetical protein GUITHDRAFT_138762 [Guillardia theta CCMP2712]